MKSDMGVVAQVFKGYRSNLELRKIETRNKVAQTPDHIDPHRRIMLAIDDEYDIQVAGISRAKPLEMRSANRRTVLSLGP